MKPRRGRDDGPAAFAGTISQYGVGRASVGGWRDGSLTEDYFSLQIEDGSPLLGIEQDRLQQVLSSRFGENLHVGGALFEDGGLLVVARSRKEDDTSKPLLRAMKKAARQLSRARPGLVVLQLNDIVPEDLAREGLRRRLSILSRYFLAKADSRHVACVCFRPYLPLRSNPEASVGLSFWNSRCVFDDLERFPFRDGVPYSDFRTLLRS